MSAVEDIKVRCQDCAVVCHKPATWRVIEASAAWFYCDEHAPDRDPGVELVPLGEGE